MTKGWELIRAGVRMGEPSVMGLYLGCTHRVVDVPSVQGGRPQDICPPEYNSLPQQVFENEKKAGKREQNEVYNDGKLFPPRNARGIVYDMKDFLQSAVDKYVELAGGERKCKLKHADTPFLDEKIAFDLSLIHI